MKACQNFKVVGHICCPSALGMCLQFPPKLEHLGSTNLDDFAAGKYNQELLTSQVKTELFHGSKILYLIFSIIRNFVSCRIVQTKSVQMTLKLDDTSI